MSQAALLAGHVAALFDRLFGSGDDVHALNEELLPVFQQAGYHPGLTLSLSVLALRKITDAQYAEALALLGQAEQHAELAHRPPGYTLLITLRAMCYNNLAEYEPALTHGIQARQLAEHGDTHPKERGIAYYTLATIYLDTHQYTDAIYYYEKSIETWRPQAGNAIIARCYNGAGAAYLATKDYEGALYCQQKALGIYEALDQARGVARSFDDLGTIYLQMGRLETAAQYLNEALALRRDLGYLDPIVTTLLHLGQLHVLQQRYDEAIRGLEEGVRLSRMLGTKGKLARLYRTMALAYKGLGDYRQSMLYFEQYHELHEQLFHNELRDKVENLEMQLKTERAERESELYRLKNVELATLNHDLEHALETIQDSIAYARRIQTALLPSQALLGRLLPASFVFYRPRDVVSGDFYWMGQQGGHTVLAVVDCTGHGVPGAFMSLLGINMLNQTVHTEGITDPAHILARMHERLLAVFGKTEVQDGMEAGIVSWDAGTLQYAGAGIPLYYQSAGGLQHIRPTPYGLGGHPQPERSGYARHTVERTAAGPFYLFSDGFKDQFGWSDARRQKFSSGRLRDLLEKATPLPLPQQATLVAHAFDSWKGSHRQIDDVLLIGFQPA